MLVLARRVDEKVVIPSQCITIEVLGVRGKMVKLGIDAPDHVRVLREEIYNADDSAQLAEHRRKFDEGQLTFAEQQIDLRRKLADGSHVAHQVAALNELHHTTGQAMELMQSAVKLAGRKALIIDNNRNERELLASSLRQMSGCVVDTFSDSELADWTTRTPDAVLLDAQSCGQSLQTIVDRIRAETPATQPRLYVLHDEGIDAGGSCKRIDGSFQKPLDMAHILRQLSGDLATDASLTA